jgi:arylsulfatase A-like enzyme
MIKNLNVLLFITDALRGDHIGCMENKVVKTPNIDRIASEGVRFTNHYCTNPICMPNRASLVTGVYPNVHGVRSNGINLRDDIPTIMQTLRKKGWHTASIGKIHHQYWFGPFRHKYRSAESLVDWAIPRDKTYPVRENFPLPYYGYEEVEVISGNGSICSGHYLQWLEEKAPKIARAMQQRVQNYDNLFSLYCEDIPEEFYNTTWVKERTIAFLERFKSGNYGNKPFYLQCSFPDPHYPLAPPKRFQKMYNPEKIELPNNFDDVKNLYDHEFLGEHLKNPPFKRAFLRESTAEEVRNITALTYAAISYVDNCIGQILASLDNMGLDNNTIVLFMSDHGDLMGDHGLLFKGPCPFNGVLHIPLIWKVPGLTKPSVSDALVSTVDIPKTILNLLQIRERYHPPDMQGYDLSPILKNPEKKARDCVLIENDEEVGTLKSRLRHLVTEDYKLTIYEGLDNFGDLYDRKNDPQELRNLWHDETYRDIRFELLNKLVHENLRIQRKYPKRIAGT